MRILVFSWRDPKHPLAGGAEQVMHEHMKAWVAAGYKVTLFASRFKNSSTEEIIDDVQIIRQGHQYLGVQISAFFYYIKNRKKFDLIIDQFHGIPFFAPLYVRKPQLAVIQETTRGVWLLNPLPKPLNWLIGVIGFIGEPLPFLFYKNIHFMTGSESAKDDVFKFGIPIKNITVVPHGVIIEKPSTIPKKEGKFTVIFLGVLSKDKGIEDALKCFLILSQKKCNFEFWVIGHAETSEYGRKIKKLTWELGLQDKVKFWGFVSQKKKFELLARAHVLVNPSVREGWGLVNIEANCMGIPVVAYQSSGLIDSVKDNLSGVLCQKNTPNELAVRILELSDNPQKYHELQRGSITWSKNFSWYKSNRLSLKLIREIMDS